MTRLVNDAAAFVDEMIDGFVAANSRFVRRVSGGVARSAESVQSTVAVVTGGGSGHYPAFGGVVGHGLAHAAAMGNVFASPSSQHVHSAVTAVDRGRGVILTYGNYAGDVVNFTLAQDRLRAEGVDCRTILVTDDIASAPRDEKHKRRGIAGDLPVLKVIGAAAEEGRSIDEVERLGLLANERTRTLGVAFSGCTLPGASAPLFTVPPGRMGVGMGIHGEPGIAEDDLPTADGLAQLLVSSLLADLPDDIDGPAGQRVVAILNGLGSVKYEELFVVYRTIDRLLTEAGVTVVEPEVGELVTSFDMAGASLTLFWLGDGSDPELERLWAAPASAPGFRKGAVTSDATQAAPIDRGVPAADAASADLPPASESSRTAARRAVAVFDAIADVIDENVDEFGRIDAIAGDGDHGIGMQRGAVAARASARESAEAGAGLATLLACAGQAWSHDAGGTSGALWGAALGAVGRVVGDETVPDAPTIGRAVDAASAAILTFGAEVGDKTMVDALVPFTDELRASIDSGASLIDAWRAAAAAATEAAAATADLLPRIGRARPHAEKSLGTPDAGAASFAAIVTRLTATLAEMEGTDQ